MAIYGPDSDIPSDPYSCGCVYSRRSPCTFTYLNIHTLAHIQTRRDVNVRPCERNRRHSTTTALQSRDDVRWRVQVNPLL